MTLTLTEKAALEVKRVIDEQKLPLETHLRVMVKGGGCSGFEYSLGFDSRADEAQDEIAEYHGIKVVVDKRSLLYLEGTSVDYHDGIERRGFVFNNPQATKTCGCGSSFSV